MSFYSHFDTQDFNALNYHTPSPIPQAAAHDHHHCAILLSAHSIDYNISMLVVMQIRRSAFKLEFYFLINIFNTSRVMEDIIITPAAVNHPFLRRSRATTLYGMPLK